MVNDLKKEKNISWIIVFKWDRLSRNIDDFNIIDKLINDMNIEIISISEPQLNSYM